MKESEDQTRFVLILGIVIISTLLLVVYLSWPFINIIILSLFGLTFYLPWKK
jgi:hypothetical protein